MKSHRFTFAAAVLAALLTPAFGRDGPTRLVVSFFDYSSISIGKKTFKDLRTSGYEHSCWASQHENVRGIGQAYIENPPKSLDGETLLEATRGSRRAAKQFASQLAAEKMDGAFAYVPDSVGRFVTIYGISAHDGAVTTAASIPLDQLRSLTILSKALCEAAASMD